MKILPAFPFFLFLLSQPLLAQSSVLDKRATLHINEEPLAEALRKAETAYQVSFSYFNQPGGSKKVSLHVHDQPLRETLAELLKGMRMSYQVIGRQVILKESLSPYLTIRGTVQDKQTGQKLAYASVSLQGKPMGTLTNQTGEFTFHVPEAYAQDTLLVSFVGYTPYRETARTLAGESAITVLLSPATVVLAEVVVADKPLTAKEIVQQAVARIEENYPTGPCLMEGFYREWQIRRSANDQRAFASLVEAAVSIHDKGYTYDTKAKRTEKVFINEIRRSAYTEDTWNKLNRLLIQNFVKYNSSMGNYDAFPPVLEFPNQLEYKVLKTVVEDGEHFHVIAVAMPGSPATCEMYISYDDYAIARIDLKGEGSAIQSLDEGKPPGRRPSRGRLTSVDNSLRFRRINNKMYLSYLRAHWMTRIVDPQSDRELEDNTFFSELLVNDVKTGNPEAETKKPAGASMNPRVPMPAQIRPYHPDFWQHYNIIADNPLDPALTELLQQQQPLEKQFTQSSTTDLPKKRKPRQK